MHKDLDHQVDRQELVAIAAISVVAECGRRRHSADVFLLYFARRFFARMV
jgi:hypothetical protein